MQKHKDFLPGSEIAFQSWHSQNKKAAAEIGAQLGITADDLAELAADNELLKNRISEATAASAVAKAATIAKNNAVRQIKSHVRKLAQRVRGHRDYTEALGLQLGIVAAEDSTDMKTSQPKLRGQALSNSQVRIRYKKSRSEGVDLYGRLEGDADWVYLGRSTFSPYLDKRPPVVAGKPELREYKAVYVIKDKPIGRESATMSVVTRP